MKRRSYILAGLFLLLSLALAGLWVSSYWYAMDGTRQGQYTFIRIHVDSGSLMAVGEWEWQTQFLQAGYEFSAFYPSYDELTLKYYFRGFRGPSSHLGWGGFGVAGGSSLVRDGSRGVGLEVPIWFPLALSLLLSYWFWRRGRNFIPPGLCRQCGYDLRASKDRCPECGTPIPPDVVRHKLAP